MIGVKTKPKIRAIKGEYGIRNSPNMPKRLQWRLLQRQEMTPYLLGLYYKAYHGDTLVLLREFQ